MTSPVTDTLSTIAVAELLGVTRGTISNWKARHQDFPDPVAGTPRSPLYDREEIFQWLISNEKATEDKLRNMSSGKLVIQLIDAMQNTGQSPELLSATICYMQLSRTQSLPASCRWDPSEADQLTEKVREADQWTRLSTETHGLPVLASLRRAVEEPATRNLVEHFLDQLSTVKDLAALHMEILDRDRGIRRMDWGVPQDIADLVAALLPEHTRSIIDPYFTDGTLALTCAQKNPDADTTAVSPFSYSAESAMRWALISGIDLRVRVGDTISGDLDETVRVDATICNAPLGTRLDQHQVRETDPRWVFGTPRGEIQWALMQDAIYRLNPGGRAIMICPKSVLFKSAGGVGVIREALIRQGCLEAVIAGPPGSLHNTLVPFCILVLTRPGEVKDPENILLVDIPKSRDRKERPDFAAAATAYRAWRESGTTDSAGPAVFVAPVQEILAPQGTLDPTKWVEAASRPSPTALMKSAMAKQEELGAALSAPASLDTGWRLHEGTVSRYATIGELAAVEILRGPPLDRRVLDTDKNRGIPVLSLAILKGAVDGDARYVDPDTIRGKAVLTKPGDVIVHPTPSGVVAIVWNEAGWLPNPHSEILRVVDQASFDPEFLALCLSSKLATAPVTVGNVVPRAQSKNITIPLMPIADQRAVVDYLREVDAVSDYARKVTAAADELRAILADAAATGITVTPT